MTTKNKRIYEKVNQAIRLLCDVYDILNEKEEIKPINTDRKMLKISTFLEIHPEFSNGQIRNYISQNIKNFNEKVTVKMGKRIFINETKFFQWLNNEI